ncbi:g4091 [Coccomyxa elongata]
MIWSQTSASSCTDSTITGCDWQCQQTFHLSSAPVAVRWLEAPSCWRWPRHPLSQDAAEPQGIESPFGPHTSAQDELPWIRLGTVACAAVMHNATFQVSWWGRAGADVNVKWYQSPPVSLSLHDNLIAADVAVSNSGAVRILAVTGAEPNKVTIMKVSGNPTVLRPDGKPYEELHVQELVTLPLTTASGKFALATFQPDSAGTAALVLLESRGSFVLARFTEDPTTGAWSQAASRAIELDEGCAGMLRLSHAHDGASMLLCQPSSNASSRLTALDSHTLQVTHQILLPGHCHSVAGSSNMCCAITAHPSLDGKGTRLLVHDLPMGTTSGTTPAAQMLSLRVCWSLVRRTSTWDVLRHVAVHRREQPNLAAELLKHLDTALHTERYTQRPAYGMALNAFKLQLLAGLSDTTARIICMDLWAHSYLQILAGQLKLLCRPEKHAPDSPMGHVLVPAEEAAALEPWVAWIDEYVPFLLGCVHRWVQARRGAGTDASKHDAMPCVRLLPEGYYGKNLWEAVAACEVVSRALDGRSGPSARTVRLKEMVETVRLISGAILQDQKATGAGANTSSEALGAHLDGAKQAQAEFSGAYGLHYYRALGAVRPIEAFIDASSGDLIAPLHDCKPLSDAEIDAAARRLGLVAPVTRAWNPRKTLKRKAPASLPPLDLDEGPFRLQDSKVLEPSALLKRQKWQADHASALGLTCHDASAGSGIDIITGERFSWALQPKFVSADGLCNTAGINAGDLSVSLFNQVFCGAAVFACPVTGSSWRRVW